MENKDNHIWPSLDPNLQHDPMIYLSGRKAYIRYPNGREVELIDPEQVRKEHEEKLKEIREEISLTLTKKASGSKEFWSGYSLGLSDAIYIINKHIQKGEINENRN